MVDAVVIVMASHQHHSLRKTNASRASLGRGPPTTPFSAHDAALRTALGSWRACSFQQACGWYLWVWSERGWYPRCGVHPGEPDQPQDQPRARAGHAGAAGRMSGWYTGLQRAELRGVLGQKRQGLILEV